MNLKGIDTSKYAFSLDGIMKTGHGKVRDILGNAKQILDPSVAKELETYIARAEGDSQNGK